MTMKAATKIQRLINIVLLLNGLVRYGCTDEQFSNTPVNEYLNVLTYHIGQSKLLSMFF